MFDEFCQCGHTKEEHVEKWFSKGIKCLGDDCKCNEFRPTKRAADGLRPLGRGAYIVEKDSKVGVSKRENARR